MSDITKTIRLAALSPAIDRAHYLVAAYDSIERWQQKIVVIVPEISEASWVLAPGTRTARKAVNRMALAVPSLQSLTLEVLQALTNVATDFMTVRAWSREDRAAGRTVPGAIVSRLAG